MDKHKYFKEGSPFLSPSLHFSELLGPLWCMIDNHNGSNILNGWDYMSQKATWLRPRQALEKSTVCDPFQNHPTENTKRHWRWHIRYGGVTGVGHVKITLTQNRGAWCRFHGRKIWHSVSFSWVERGIWFPTSRSTIWHPIRPSLDSH